MSEIVIEDLTAKIDIEDSNLIIVEDDDDTKKSTILELKRAFNGDSSDPEIHKYYSSKYISELINSLSVQLSAMAPNSSINELKQQLANIITSNGSGKDSELVAARGTYPTLSERLEGDMDTIENKFLQYPIDSLTGTIVDVSKYYNGTVEVSAPAVNTATTIYVEGFNRINIPASTQYPEVIPINNRTGLQYTLTRAKNNFSIPFRTDGGSIPAGTYYFYSLASSTTTALMEKASLRITYADGATMDIPYNFNNVVCLSLTKYANSFTIVFDTDNIVNGAVVKVENIMLCSVSGIDTYYKYCDSTIAVKANQNLSSVVDVHGVQYIRRSSGIINVTVKDDTFTGTFIRSEINRLDESINNTADYCGLISDPGEYFYADKVTVADNDICIVSSDPSKNRNGHDSVHIQFMDYNSIKPQFTMYLQNQMDIKTSGLVSIQLYIDTTTFERFSDSDGIQILFSSDGIIDPVNYFHINLGRSRFVQGWNTIKIKSTELLKHGSPKGDQICTVTFKVFFSEALSGKEMWVNSVIVGQKMKPTVLLAFDGLFESGFDYQYPYLYSRNIPVTIFANDKNTLTKDQMDKVALLRYQYGWDLANDGCNPNKEIMGKDDNCREQYMAVKTTMQYLVDNYCSKITAYNAPFGILRPITVPILDRLGFKIAKVSGNSYCSFFSDNDLAIPMHLLSNTTTAEKIIEKIKYIIETGQTICICTGNVTKYGDEITAKMESFETVISYIEEQMKLGNLQCLTFEDFYNKCTQR